MHNILEEFAYGNISPQAQSCRKDSEMGQAMALIVRIEEKLIGKLNAEETELLTKFTDAHSEMNRLTAVQNLLYGYKLGVIMTAEAFVTSRDLIAGA